MFLKIDVRNLCAWVQKIPAAGALRHTAIIEPLGFRCLPREVSDFDDFHVYFAKTVSNVMCGHPVAMLKWRVHKKSSGMIWGGAAKWQFFLFKQMVNFSFQGGPVSAVAG